MGGCKTLPGSEAKFQTAFADARSLIACQPGFRSLRLERCLGQPNRFLLLVEWDSLEDHTDGFRTSPEYERWSELLHAFYGPFPRVEHYETVLEERPPSRDKTTET